MRAVALLIVVSSDLLVLFSEAQPRRCSIAISERKPCGYNGIPEDYCWGSGCCYDDSKKGGETAWCYTASTNRFIDEKALTLLRLGGVPPEVILGLYVDATPGAEWLMAFRSGQLDTAALLRRIAGTQLNLSPTLSKILAGADPVKVLFSSFATASGISSELFELMFDRRFDVVLKHLLYLLSARDINPDIPYGILSDVLNGSPLNSSQLVRHYAERLIPAGDKFLRQFYKELLAGNTTNAVQWAYLSALRYRIPQRALYPQNAGLFSHLVRTQQNYPGKISPSLILALAKGAILPGLNTDGKPFVELFGVPAKLFICAAHSPNTQIACEKLKNRYYPTAKDCIDADCCFREPESVGQQGICYENILGTIGAYLAQSIIDEKYITEMVLGGEDSLPSMDDFIPWLPSTSLPGRFTNWLETAETDGDIFIDKYPTVAPLGPSHLRPGFQWEPHGPTTFPFVPRLPGGLLVPTQEPGILNPHPDPGSHQPAPLISQLSLSGFGSSCRLVRREDKVGCISNSIALSSGGEQTCIDQGCCYDPDFGDLTVPACFRLVSYGQCYDIPYPEREECGAPGIDRQACLENPQCCFDSALPIANVFAKTPWCFYKKRAPLLSKDKCSRVSNKVKCFESDSINSVVSKATCESAGCCFDDSLPSAFDVSIGLGSYSPTCFKAATNDLTPTDPPPNAEHPSTVTTCRKKNDLPPHLRVDCKIRDPFECRAAGCCYEPVFFLTFVPWCFAKSTVAA